MTPMDATIVAVSIDGEISHFCELADCLDDDEIAEDAARLYADIATGQTYRAGGGAAPLVEIFVADPPDAA